MTEQEQKAIKWMKSVRDDAIVTLDHIAKEEPNVSPMLYAGRKEKAETIIKAFEELQQYRAIGTVEECWEAVEKQQARDRLAPLHPHAAGSRPDLVKGNGCPGGAVTGHEARGYKERGNASYNNPE